MWLIVDCRVILTLQIVLFVPILITARIKSLCWKAGNKARAEAYYFKTVLDLLGRAGGPWTGNQEALCKDHSILVI